MKISLSDITEPSRITSMIHDEEDNLLHIYAASYFPTRLNVDSVKSLISELTSLVEIMRGIEDAKNQRTIRNSQTSS